MQPENALQTERLRVLIVDDDAACATGLAEAVEDLGALARICIRGKDAMAAARDFSPEMILLDLDMPGLSGFDIASTIRAMTSMHATKLIAISGHNDAEARRDTARAGFDLHLAKPVRLAVLEDIVDLTRTILGYAAPPPSLASAR
ncbi:MAG: response regulator [Asticcacaulis sp.]|uniref:response regulator n=1 Tax=Asticcacaulis sp. TaxID=1872648 RepID=UPI0039E68667